MHVLLADDDDSPPRVVHVAHDGDATVADLLEALEALGTDGSPAITGTPTAPIVDDSGIVVDGHWRTGALPLADVGLRHGSRLQTEHRAHLMGSGRPVASPVVALEVVGGLLAGQHHPLAPGDHVVGRVGTVVLAHPTVSGHHLRLQVGTGRAVHVCDLASRNGIRVDGRWLTHPTAVEHEQILQLGAVQVTLRPPWPPPGTRAVDARGRAPWHRPPRTATLDDHVPIAVPAAPQPPPARTPFAWSAATVPLVLGLAMAAVLGPMFALFALLTPLAVAGGWVEHRLRARRHRRRCNRRLEEDAATLGDAVAEAARRARRRLAEAHPDPAQIVRRATTNDPSLWERRPHHDDAFVLRVGTATVPWSAPIDPAPDPRWSSRGPLAERVARHDRLADAPITVDLRRGDVGIAGPADAVAAVVRNLVLQAAVLHGPADLAVCADEDDLDWARWLPHHRPDPGEGVELVLHVGPHRPRQGSRPRSPRWIATASDVHHLPASCRTVVRLDGADGVGSVTDVDSGHCQEGVLVDGLGRQLVTDATLAFAHLLDPELDRSGKGSLPARVSLHEVLELTPEAIAERWGRAGPGLPMTLGRAGRGRLDLDLVADGPHALVAGTTGSGKSELLRTLVAALAASAPPDHLAFVLLDFKGGSAFDRCTALPHVVGVVTDLDGSLVHRVLRGLEVELRHREARLRAAGADDLDELRRTRRPGEDPMPRLVLVVDEFAVLATEAPDVLGGLVDVAQRGRSLGIHLVLATQRPSGIVTDRIRANTNLRLVLRTVDATDSFDLLGTADAVSLDRHAPGRVLVRAGADEVRTGQTALVTGPARRKVAPVRVHVVALPGVEPDPAGERTTTTTTDLDDLVRATDEVARLERRRPATAVWSDPLPNLVHRRTLESAGAAGSAGGGSDGAGLALGLLDDVEHRSHPVWRWHPDQGHLVVHGASGSGVTSTLAAAGAAAAARGAEVVVVDPAAGLREDAESAHWAATADPDDRHALGRLVERSEQADRAGRLLVVAVDRWHATAAALDDLEGARLLDRLVRLVARGPAAGVVGLIGLDRATGLPAPLAPAASQRVVLRLSDPHDVGLVGVSLPTWARHRLVDAPPGRGVAAPVGLEVQVVHR